MEREKAQTETVVGAAHHQRGMTDGFKPSKQRIAALRELQAFKSEESGRREHFKQTRREDRAPQGSSSSIQISDSLQSKQRREDRGAGEDGGEESGRRGNLPVEQRTAGAEDRRDQRLAEGADRRRIQWPAGAAARRGGQRPGQSSFPAESGRCGCRPVGRPSLFSLPRGVRPFPPSPSFPSRAAAPVAMLFPRPLRSLLCSGAIFSRARALARYRAKNPPGLVVPVLVGRLIMISRRLIGRPDF